MCRRTRPNRRRGRSRLPPAAVGDRAAFAEILGYHQAAGPPVKTIRLTLHIDIFSHQLEPAKSSIRHPDYPICLHLTAKHGNIVELGFLSITSTSCDPGRERLLPNLVCVRMTAQISDLPVKSRDPIAHIFSDQSQRHRIWAPFSAMDCDNLVLRAQWHWGGSRIVRTSSSSSIYETFSYHGFSAFDQLVHIAAQHGRLLGPLFTSCHYNIY
jgi:hypothetical protein